MPILSSHHAVQAARWTGVGLLTLLAGCMMHPEGTAEQREELKAAGRPYDQPVEKRELPELPMPATWQDVLRRALLANGDLEAAYHEWHAANERIDMVSYWPNSNLNLGFSYMFSPGNIKAWDRTTVTAQPDPSAPLKLPQQAKQGGQVALDQARELGEKFRAAKFRIQKQVLNSYLDLALMEEDLRIGQENCELLKQVLVNARSRVQGGAPQQDLIKAQVQVHLAENMLQSEQAQTASMRAMLNGMMGRPADAALTLPARLPEARDIPVADDRLIAVGVERNPELAGLAQQVAGRKDAVELAKMQFLPSINPTAGFTGSLSQSLGAMVMLPTTIPMINAQIRESKAMLEASAAMLRQTRSERAASFVATLYALRNAERQEAFYRQTILPMTRQLLTSSRQDYASGRVGMVELIDAQRTLLDVRRTASQFHIEREKRLAELEELAGVDVETLAANAATQPTMQAATQPATQAMTSGVQVHHEGAKTQSATKSSHE